MTNMEAHIMKNNEKHEKKMKLKSATREELIDELLEIDPDGDYLMMDDEELAQEYWELAKNCLKEEGFNGIEVHG